ncbi:MAG: DUF3793 family protein [Lachnospiraceae bacterium]|nr:DUF3793 family protein [Lachnospiraceae bacterium]
MTDKTLVESCAPTLAGLKTASLITVGYPDRESCREAVCAFNRRFAEKGLRVIPMRYRSGRALLYIYRPSMLKKDMEDAKTRQMLCEMGYCCPYADVCVAQLAQRMKAGEDFPHEVGLFLGYPADDVHGFIHHKYEGCTHIGDWRVYGDAEEAKVKFARFKKCREIYRNLFRDGRSADALTVKTA